MAWRSLFGLLEDGAHGGDDCGLGAAGSGGYRDNARKRGSGGEESGLGQRDGHRRVPLTLPLLGLSWRRERGRMCEMKRWTWKTERETHRGRERETERRRMSLRVKLRVKGLKESYGTSSRGCEILALSKVALAREPFQILVLSFKHSI